MPEWMKKGLLLIALTLIGYLTLYLLLWFACLLVGRWLSRAESEKNARSLLTALKGYSRIESYLDRLVERPIKVSEAMGLAAIGGIVFILVSWLIEAVWSIWPSPHMWNEIMFGAVFLPVVVGIVALTIFIVRSLRAR